MPLRANKSSGDTLDGVGKASLRATVEWVLRGASLLLLGFLIWQAFHALGERPMGRAQGADVRSALVRWSTRESPGRAHVVFDSIAAPSPDVRDWLAALRGAATRTSWYGPELKPSAIAVNPVPDPTHPVRIWVAAPVANGVLVRDALGVIDSVTVRAGGGAVFTTSHVNGVVRAGTGDSDAGAATAVLRDSLSIKPVLILAIASWEAKFILASLEEYGWKIDARLGLSPAGDVVQGPPSLRIDTAHYAAVIALDTSAAKYAERISSYVREGGGFIAAGDAAALPAFAMLLPGKTASALQDAPFEADSAHPRRSLALTPLTQLKPDAVIIETRDGKAGGNTAVAARRIGTGRVLQVGYLDTWRWRMGGLDNPVSDYRAWWSTMVSSVAYAPRTAYPVTASVEPTPLATLIATLGPSVQLAAERGTFLNDPRLLPILFVVLMSMLFAEWSSRRLRGRP